MARIENWNPPTLSVNKAIYEWPVDYAADVHEGAIRGDTVFPARPWTDDALSRTDVAQEFRQAWISSEDLDESFQELAQIMFNEFHVSMASDIYTWPRTTYRKNGEVADSPRNIIDTQELYNSQSVSLEYGSFE
jgi:hypothetical protein